MTGPLTRLEPMPTATAAPLVLGIESSCDETGVGVVRGTALLAHEVASSVEEHVRFGGVIPEIAARAHLEALVPTIRRALDTADVTLADLDAIAVTSGPGLAGALMVGVAGAKALATALGTPLYGINHLVAHVGVGMLDGVRPAQWDDLPADLGALLVSGGHTEILRVGRISSVVELLGSTIDDAAGEAYDKVARLIGAGYPGGPVIDRMAAEGDPKAFRYPRGLTAGKFVGTAEEFADLIEELGEWGNDGVLLWGDFHPVTLHRTLDELVPVLRRRGILRREYAEGGLQANLRAF